MPESDVTVSATFIIEGITGSEVFIDGRNITIRPTLWASDHEVTQAEYQAVMGTNPSEFKDSLHAATIRFFASAIDFRLMVTASSLIALCNVKLSSSLMSISMMLWIRVLRMLS